MKTNKLFTAILMAAALCVNFTSCSDDEEGGGSNSEGATKRLVKMEVSSYDGNTEISLEYDSQGRVSKMVESFADDGSQSKETFLYSYNGDELTISETDEEVYHESGEEHSTEEVNVYQLNNKGYVTSGTFDIDYTSSFEYTDDYLVSISIEPNYIYGNYDRTHTLLSDGKVLPDGWDSMEYSDIPNKGNLFYMYSHYEDIFIKSNWWELYFANLVGKAPKYLPKSATFRNTTTHYSYELDDDGYVKAFTITDGDVTASYKCTYENI